MIKNNGLKAENDRGKMQGGVALQQKKCSSNLILTARLFKEKIVDFHKK